MQNIKKSRTLSMVIAIITVTMLAMPLNASAIYNGAFCVGTNYGSGVDTSGDATTAQNAYSSAGYNVETLLYPTVTGMRGNSADGTKRIRDKILFFSGHGNYSCVSFNYLEGGGNYRTGVYYYDDYDSSSTEYKYVGIHNNMGNVTLATFAACNTASNSGDNIASRACQYGADAAVGWSTTTSSASHPNWLQRYNNYLASGHNVNDSVAYANSFTYLPGSGVKNAVIYGSGSILIANPSTLVRTGGAEQLKLLDITEDASLMSIHEDTIDVNKIVKIISKSYPDFNINDYTVNRYDICDGSFTIDLIRKIGEFETNSAFTAIVSDNQLIKIVDNSKTIQENATLNTRNSSFTNIELESDALSQAANIVRMDKHKEVANQDIYYYYDIDTNTKYIVVQTAYYYDGTNAMGMDTYTAVI